MKSNMRRKKQEKQVSTDFQNDAWFLYLGETVQGIFGNICVEIIFLRMSGAGLAWARPTPTKRSWLACRHRD